MTEYLILFLAITISAILLIFSYRSFGKKKWVSTGSALLLSIPVIAVSVLTASTIIDKSTIERLTKEHTIATIQFKNLGNHHYQASFTEPFQQSIEFEIY